MTCYLFIGTNLIVLCPFSGFKHSAKQNCYRGKNEWRKECANKLVQIYYVSAFANLSIRLLFSAFN